MPPAPQPLLPAPSADPAHLPCCRPSHRCSPPWAARVCLGHSSPAGWPPGPQGPRSRMPALARREVSAVSSTSAGVPSLSADPTGHWGGSQGETQEQPRGSCDLANTSPASDAWRGSGLAPQAGSGGMDGGRDRRRSWLRHYEPHIWCAPAWSGRRRQGKTAREMDRQTLHNGSKAPRGKATQALTADHTTKLR